VARTDSVSISAHAKANLLLRVLARETSGFHSIETLFVLLELHDSVTVERTVGGIELQVDGADTGPAEENLAHRAAELLLMATGNRFGARIRLEKSIPVRGGLGGGSSDGAATLHALNQLSGNAVPRHEILRLAAQLGSDVPFFASGVAMALAWGRGERLFRLSAPKPAPVLLAVPEFGVSTKEAYELISQGGAALLKRGPVVLDLNALKSWGEIGRLGGNDFEVPLFGREPRLKDLFERVAWTRPLLVRVSGSGSAVIALYKSERDRDNAALEIGERDQQLIRTKTKN